MRLTQDSFFKRLSPSQNRHAKPKWAGFMTYPPYIPYFFKNVYFSQYQKDLINYAVSLFTGRISYPHTTK
jgi:hypothetical protein